MLAISIFKNKIHSAFKNRKKLKNSVWPIFFMVAQPENYENDICIHISPRKNVYLVLILLHIDHIIRKETKSVISEVLK